MVMVMIQRVTRDGSIDTQAIVGPFGDDNMARAWAEENVDHRTVWTTEDVTAPW